ncbi:MAG: hypothetical protein KR126chlam2_01293 [Chlamydiae bacterium]|nr:hypothetical protein [Chlamydiota bacterium]
MAASGAAAQGAYYSGQGTPWAATPPAGPGTVVTDSLDKTFAPLTKKLSFIRDKVVRVVFVIFLICGVTMGAAALIVNYPVITSGFFAVLTVVGSISLIGMAWRGIDIALKNRREAKAEQSQL